MAVTIIAPGASAELSPQVPFGGRKVHTGRPKFGIAEPFSADGFVSPLGRALSLTVARSEVKDASSRGEALWARSCGADLSPSVSNRGKVAAGLTALVESDSGRSNLFENGNQPTGRVVNSLVFHVADDAR
jgi:hypothetical protein